MGGTRSSATLMLVVFAAILLGVAGSAIAASNGNSGALQACLCEEWYFLWDYDYMEGTYTWAWAYVEGWVCIPSDGNLYDVKHDWSAGKKPGAPDVPVIVFSYPGYVDRQCPYGDEAFTIVVTFVDPDRDGLYHQDARAEARIAAAPCCAT